MSKRIIYMDRKELDKVAETYLCSSCGFNLSLPKYRNMFDTAEAVREEIIDFIRPRAVIASFCREVINGRMINLNGTPFECSALEQIDAGKILRLYAYILTAGNIEYTHESVLNMFYADTWGTSYVDAARDMLRIVIKDDFAKEFLESGINNQNGLYVSDSFGPGYYGMGVTETGKFFKILDGKEIGMTLESCGLMRPLKSCVGFYLVTADEGSLPPIDCKSCLGNSKGCQFCRSNKARRITRI